MLEIEAIGQLRSWRRQQREEGRRVGLVPTMGALHEGHLALVDRARDLTDRVAMSVFVNPLQFGPGEDFTRYPRNLDRDRALAADRGVDLLFVPTVEALYPEGADTRVVPGAAAGRWEGSVRAGHFAGVLTVVAKLFNLVQPDVAVFGQKDIQQVTLVRRMVDDLDFPLRVVVSPTVRDADGLALSSRNVYLDAWAREQALGLSRALVVAEGAFAAGERDSATLEALIREVLVEHPGLREDYIAITDPERLEPVAEAVPGTIVALAARVGTTRLIDNTILGAP
ncbi:MAG TPA: pantoate--beta-alanine ligase [Gemmatimonadales bacterium]|nr:pantoate--beta-alanine ligase [Gemmatimonadales bacterium]